MYDRAARSLNLTVGCTPDHVGPGTYDHPLKKFSTGLLCSFSFHSFRLLI